MWLCFSCKPKDNGSLRITGTYVHAQVLASAPQENTARPPKLYLEEMGFGSDQSPQLLDSVLLNGDQGNFRLGAAKRKQGIYELVSGGNLIIVPLIADTGEIQVDLDLDPAKKDDFYTVSGSTASMQLKDLIEGFGKRNFIVERHFETLDSLRKVNASDSVMIGETTAKNASITNLNDFLRSALRRSSDPTLAAVTLGWCSRTFPREEFESIADEMIRKYPGSSHILSQKERYEEQMQAMAKSQEENAWVGRMAPDLALPDASGKAVSLSSFRGKWLLVDFWASWCGPCREENPNVVKAFNKYKGKNFTILGVSLDKEKDPWQQAVQDDKLAWTQVSDLKFWNSKAVEVFKFEGIPFNILVNPSGQIVAQELRGSALDEKLGEVLK